MPKPLARFSPVLESLDRAETSYYNASPCGISSPRYFRFPKSATFPPVHSLRNQDAWRLSPARPSPPSTAQKSRLQHSMNTAPTSRINARPPVNESGFRTSRFTEALPPGEDTREVLLSDPGVRERLEQLQRGSDSGTPSSTNANISISKYRIHSGSPSIHSGSRPSRSAEAGSSYEYSGARGFARSSSSASGSEVGFSSSGTSQTSFSSNTGIPPPGEVRLSSLKKSSGNGFSKKVRGMFRSR